MSKYSGKCDFADLLAGLSGWFDKDGHRVKFGDPQTSVYYSDEMLDFLEFKKRTKGIIHQHRTVKVSIFNQDLVAQKNPHFRVEKHIKKIPDKRTKAGYRETETYTYYYHDQECTLKEINKKGIRIILDIPFDTLLDIIPYYPYLVSSCCSTEECLDICISENSYVDRKYFESLEFGHDNSSWVSYKKKLQDHYKDVVLRYFNPENKDKEYPLHLNLV